MLKIIPVASGKGGVGKSLFSSNLGLALAAKGKTVILADLDFGGANLHTCLGIKNNFDGIGTFLNNPNVSLESLITATENPRLFFIHGDVLIPGTANMQHSKKIKLIKSIKNLTADFIILDLSSGSAFNTVDFFLMSQSGIIIINPETTSILNAYSFIKTAFFRLIMLKLPVKSVERKQLIEFFAGKRENRDLHTGALYSLIEGFDSSIKDNINSILKTFSPKIIINMGRKPEDLNLGLKLRDICRKNLGIPLEYLGYIGFEKDIYKSIVQRTPFFTSSPSSPYVFSIKLLADKIINMPYNELPADYDDNEDIEKILEEIYSAD